MGSAKTSSIIRSSGNVFADLGVPQPDEKDARVRLAFAINQIIRSRQLSQMAAARLLDVSQPKISALRNYQLEGFSIERLMRFLNSLGHDVDIVIRKKPRSRRAARIGVAELQSTAV